MRYALVNTTKVEATKGAKGVCPNCGAEVKIEDGWVLEFQHSFLNPSERQARNDFYKKLVWIIVSGDAPPERRAS